MEIVGKQWQKDTLSEVFTAIDIEGGFVKFSNGAQCKLETFINDFKEVKSSNINESIINTQKINTNKTNDIDPDAFFNFAGDDNDPLMKQLEQIKQNPNIVLKPTVDIVPSIDRTDNKILSAPVQQLNVLESRMQLLNNSLTDTQHTTSQNIMVAQKNVGLGRLPEWDMFDRSKKTINAKFQIPIDIMLPKASILETLNEMFETTCTSYLAKQYVDKILQNPKELVDKLTDDIEDWLSIQLTGKKKKKVVVKQTKTSIKKKDVVNSIPASDEVSEIDVLLNRNITFDLSIPLAINNDDDLLIVKNKIKELNDQPLTKDIEDKINGLQDMMILYTANKTQ